MLRATVQLRAAVAQAVPFEQVRFNDIIQKLWRAEGRPSRMGIALSGGSDSMALTALCHNLQQQRSFDDGEAHDLKFEAYLIDHSLRPESFTEAMKVKYMVKAKTGMHVSVKSLHLEDIRHGYGSEGSVETAARRYRYRILGQGCANDNIKILLLGHHLDDAAETILTRMCNGYLGSGLQGIKSQANIPECLGMYNVGSSNPRLLSDQPSAGIRRIMQQGIQVVRPLLSATKAELVATCVTNSMEWVEDSTNKDPTFTLRNAIRDLLDHDDLPVALRRSSLLDLARQQQESVIAVKRAAEDLFKLCLIKMDLGTGVLHLTIPRVVEDAIRRRWERGSLSVGRLTAFLIRRIILLVSRSDEMKDLHRYSGPMELLFPFLFKNSGSVSTRSQQRDCTLAYTSWTVDDSDARGVDEAMKQRKTYTIRPLKAPSPRTVPMKAANFNPTLYETFRSTKNPRYRSHSLWENRFWLKLKQTPADTPDRRVLVRFLEEEDMTELRRGPFKSETQQLEAILKTRAPGPIRYTLPAITMSERTSSEAYRDGDPGRVVALPSLGWSLPGWKSYDAEETDQDMWLWDICYRYLDFEETEVHKFIT